MDVPFETPPAPLPPPTRTAPPVPPIALVFAAVLSVQLGSAIAKHLFASIGPGGSAFLRLAFGALLLLALLRPRLRGYDPAAYRAAILFGLAVAAMNFSFYSALARIPLGVAVTLEFVGPLGVAVAGSRRALDLLWIGLAAAGIILLTPWGGLRLDPAGVLFALLAGSFWAAYILLSARVGRAFPGAAGLAIALLTGALALAPVATLVAGRRLLTPLPLLLGAGVGVLSSLIPYSAEMEALRHLPTRVFGVLMSTEPAVGTLVGFVLLGQSVNARALLAVALVSIASAGASETSRRQQA